MDKLLTQPLGIKIGDIHKAYNNISRQILSIDLKSDIVTFIEEPDGARVQGFCSILDFLHWKDSK